MVHKLRKVSFLFAFLILVLLSTSCSMQQTPTLTSPLVSPLSVSAEEAVGREVRGKLLRLDGSPVRFVQLYAAIVSTKSSEFSVAAVDLSSPSTKTDSEGVFLFKDLPPGRYALTASPLPGQFILLVDRQSKPVVFETNDKPSQVVELGDLFVNYAFRDGG